MIYSSPLIASPSPEEHQQHLRTVLARLQDHGIVINPTKSVLGAEHLDFLGHYVDSTGIRPLENKVQFIRDFLKPATQRKLREFLELVNFYHRFLPNCATILVPLNSMLSSAQHSQAPFDLVILRQHGLSSDQRSPCQRITLGASQTRQTLVSSPMPRALQWVPYCSNALDLTGALLPSSLRSSSPVKLGTVPLIVSCSQLT